MFDRALGATRQFCVVKGGSPPVVYAFDRALDDLRRASNLFDEPFEDRIGKLLRSEDGTSPATISPRRFFNEAVRSTVGLTEFISNYPDLTSCSAPQLRLVTNRLLAEFPDRYEIFASWEAFTRFVTRFRELSKALVSNGALSHEPRQTCTCPSVTFDAYTWSSANDSGRYLRERYQNLALSFAGAVYRSFTPDSELNHNGGMGTLFFIRHTGIGRSCKFFVPSKAIHTTDHSGMATGTMCWILSKDAFETARKELIQAELVTPVKVLSDSIPIVFGSGVGRVVMGLTLRRAS